MKSNASKIAQDVSELRGFFLSNGTKSLSSRRQVLLQLKKLLQDNEQVLQEAVYLDLHKNPIETKMTEIMLLLTEIQEHLDYFEEWSQPKRVGTNISNQPGSSYIYKEPLGVICILGTWNFPIQLLLLPLIGCISAGNCALLRLPADNTCMNSNKILKDLIETYMDPKWIRVVAGGIDETQIMLQQRFDLIFCTGGTVS
jgi:aldehyde dehydrogenase (NAD+)